MWSLYKQSPGGLVDENLLVVRSKWHRLALLADAYTGKQEKLLWDLSAGWETQSDQGEMFLTSELHEVS